MAKLKYKMIELKEAGHPTFIKKSFYLYFSKKIEYIKLDRDKSTFKSHRDFSSEKEISFKHF